MSHTTTLKPDIRNVQAIKAAARELGIPVKVNAVPRMFYASQHPKPADFVLQLKGRYDVALDKQKNGTYALAFDAWGGDIAREIGNPLVKGPVSTVAKFLQTYAKHAAILAAQAKGYYVAGCTVDAKGNVNLTLNVP